MIIPAIKLTIAAVVIHKSMNYNLIIMTQNINISVTLSPKTGLEKAFKKAGVKDPV